MLEMLYVDEVFSHPHSANHLYFRCGNIIYEFDKYKCRLNYDPDAVIKDAHPVHLPSVESKVPVSPIVAKVYYKLQIQPA